MPVAGTKLAMMPVAGTFPPPKAGRALKHIKGNEKERVGNKGGCIGCRCERKVEEWPR